MKSKKEKVAGLILAAGASTRMGRPKQLLPAGGLSLLDRVLGEALGSDLDMVILVLGYQAKEIKGSLRTDPRHLKLRIIENRNYGDGLSSSIVTGLSAVEEEFGHVMIMLADMPHITSHLINRLLYQYLESGLPLGAIKIKNRRSHPVIFGRRLYPDLHQLRGDVGARDLFLKYPGQVCLVEPEKNYDDMDIDSREDYVAFKKSFEDSK